MIIVFGSINIDLVTAVPRIPRAGETVLGETYESVPGGKGANQALAAARVGAAVEMIGAVGDDAFASIALSGLREAGVGLSGVSRASLPTGAAFIGVDPEGRNAIIVAAGANVRADAEAVVRHDLGPQTLLLLQREVPDDESEKAARAVKEAGGRVILNLAPYGRVSERYLSAVDILIMNDHEAADLAASRAQEDPSSVRPGDLARDLKARHGIDVIVTMGANGAIAWNGAGEHRAPSLPIEAIDTTGAGDTFVGAFAAGLAEGMPFVEALRFGCAAGSLACMRAGARTGIPRRAAIDEALSR